MNNVYDYYDGTGLLSRNAYFNMCIGGRNIGKTFFFKRHFIKQWLKFGKEFIYLRRTETELEKIDKEKFFPMDLLKMVFDNFKLDNIKLIKGVCEITFNCDNIEHNLNKSINSMKISSSKILINGEIVCYMKALSTWVKLKGSEYDNVWFIVFDEVLIDMSSHTKSYLPNEYNGLIQLLTSVFRRRKNRQVFLLSNATDYNNPYFNHFNFTGNNNKRFWKLKDELPNGKKHTFGYIEFPENIGITAEDDPDYYLLSKNTDVFESNVNNTFQRTLSNNIGKLKGVKIRLYNIFASGCILGVYSCNNLLYISKMFDKNEAVFSFNIKDVDFGITVLEKQHPYAKGIKKCFYNNKLWYESNDCRILFTRVIEKII